MPLISKLTGDPKLKICMFGPKSLQTHQSPVPILNELTKELDGNQKGRVNTVLSYGALYGIHTTNEALFHYFILRTMEMERTTAIVKLSPEFKKDDFYTAFKQPEHTSFLEFIAPFSPFALALYVMDEASLNPEVRDFCGNVRALYDTGMKVGLYYSPSERDIFYKKTPGKPGDYQRRFLMELFDRLQSVY